MLILISKLILGFFIFQMIYMLFGLIIIGKEYILAKIGYYNWRLSSISKNKKFNILKKILLSDIKNKLFLNENDCIMVPEKIHYNDELMLSFIKSLEIEDFECFFCYERSIDYFYKYLYYQKRYTLSDHEVYWGEVESTPVSIIMMKELRKNNQISSLYQSHCFKNFLNKN